MIVDGKLLNLVDRLHELKQRREQIDNEIAQAASELVSYCRGQEGVTTNITPAAPATPPMTPLVNGAGPAPTAVAGAPTPPTIPPTNTLQGKVFAWLRLQTGDHGSGAIAVGVEHNHDAIKSTLHAMKKKGLLQRVGRDQWRTVEIENFAP